MKGQLAVVFVFGAGMGSILSIFLGQGVGTALSFLARLFLAVFFGSTLGHIALGLAIGGIGGLLLGGWATAVFRSPKPASKQPKYGVA